MIYWFTGQPSSGKTTLGSKLHKFLETEKRNWRKSVFHIDGDDLRKLTVNKDYSDLREEFKTKMKDEIVEIYLHTTERRERYKYRARDYEKPEIKFIDVDTTKDSADTSFSKIINHLNKLEKL